MRQRPTSVLVIAILHLVFGSLGLMCNLCGLGSQMAGMQGNSFAPRNDPQQAEVQRKMENAMEQAAPHGKLVQIANTAFSLCFAVMLLAAGIGLLNMAPWARGLSISYGILALIENIGMAIYTILMIIPAMDTMMSQMLQAQLKTAQDKQVMETIVTGTKAVMFVTVLFPLIYPFVVLLVMNTTTVKNAFRGNGDVAFGEERERTLMEGFPPGDSFRPGPDDRFKG